MRRLLIVSLAGTCFCCAAALAFFPQEWKSGKVWPEPKIIDPGPPGGPPADAIMLFDGKDLSQWEGGDKWLIADGVATVHGGGITTRQPFGDCQLHLEWASPAEVKGSGQGRGNSGVYLLGKFEVQVLDSFNNPTYHIVFKAPTFDEDGKLKTPAFVTVLHNGVLIQNHVQLEGATAWDRPPAYSAHPPKQPLQLQDHGNPVRFRNIWIREL
jgi:hypothetical protein